MTVDQPRDTAPMCGATWSPGEAKNNPWWLEVAMRLNSEPCLTASVRGYAGKNAKRT